MLALRAGLPFQRLVPDGVLALGVADTAEEDFSETRALLREVWTRYLPNKIVAQTREGDARAAEIVPLLRERPMIEGLATAYVCENYTCQRPTNAAEELGKQLSAGAALRNASGGV